MEFVLSEHDIALALRTCLGAASTVGYMLVVLRSAHLSFAVVADPRLLQAVFLVILKLCLGLGLGAPLAGLLGVEVLIVLLQVIDIDELRALIATPYVSAAVRVVAIDLRLRKQLLAVVATLLALVLHAQFNYIMIQLNVKLRAICAIGYPPGSRRCQKSASRSLQCLCASPASQGRSCAS